jgi:hypothetical protein
LFETAASWSGGGGCCDEIMADYTYFQELSIL